MAKVWIVVYYSQKPYESDFYQKPYVKQSKPQTLNLQTGHRFYTQSFHHCMYPFLGLWYFMACSCYFWFYATFQQHLFWGGQKPTNLWGTAIQDVVLYLECDFATRGGSIALVVGKKRCLGGRTMKMENLVQLKPVVSLVVFAWLGAGHLPSNIM